MLLPSALILGRYRAFRDNIRVPLAPITILIGRNGGGKSVLTRLILLVSAGLAKDADAPINLAAGGIDNGSRFEDLSHNRSTHPFTIGAEISDGTSTWSFSTSLGYIVESHNLSVTGFTLNKNGRVVCRIIQSDPEQVYADKPNYDLTVAEAPESRTTKANFVGIFPNDVDCDFELSSELAEAREAFRIAFSHPSYLGPFRAEPTGSVRIPRQGIRTLGTRGERAVELLGDDVLRGNGELSREVENWFNSNFQGNRVFLSQEGSLPRLFVHDPQRGIDVDLTETGAGFAQILPIVVQAYAKSQDKIDSNLLLVEQPELHLHPAAHGSIADLMIDTAISKNLQVRYLCETHSEQLIMRLRRRIAEQKISENQVVILSVGHRDSDDGPIEALRTITFDAEANPSSWPEGVFDEALSDLIGLREALRNRSQAVEGAE